MKALSIKQSIGGKLLIRQNNAFVAFGSNLNSPEKQLKKCITTLRNHQKIHLSACTKVIETKPLKSCYTGQENYVNAIFFIKTIPI